MSVIKYPISANYVSHWGIWEAAREILQNAMDAPQYNVSYTDGEMIVTNPGSLNLKALLLGESDKAEGARGQYGEGLKLAMLIAAREKRTMRVWTGSELQMGF